MAHFRTRPTPQSPQIKAADVYRMSVRLLARHGSLASDVAAFAAAEHASRGDRMRRDAWHAVGSTVDDMIAKRLDVSGFTVH